MRLYHQDLYKGADAAERMAKINQAYEILSDKEKRKEHDATRSNNLPEDDPICDSTEYNDEEFFGASQPLAGDIVAIHQLPPEKIVPQRTSEAVLTPACV